METAAQTDKKAIDTKFVAEIENHVLDDLNGKCPKPIADKLRSVHFAHPWHLCLLRLLGKTPADSDYAMKIKLRIQEAQVWVKQAGIKRHADMMAAKSERKPGSAGNRAQVAAIVHTAYLKLGFPRDEAIEKACEDAEEIMKRTEDVRI